MEKVLTQHPGAREPAAPRGQVRIRNKGKAFRGSKLKGERVQDIFGKLGGSQIGEKGLKTMIWMLYSKCNRGLSGL